MLHREPVLRHVGEGCFDIQHEILGHKVVFGVLSRTPILNGYAHITGLLNCKKFSPKPYEITRGAVDLTEQSRNLLNTFCNFRIAQILDITEKKFLQNLQKESDNVWVIFF